jgi:hypothetical protein
LRIANFSRTSADRYAGPSSGWEREDLGLGHCFQQHHFQQHHRASPVAVLPPGWQCRDQRRYGGSTVVLLEMVLLEMVLLEMVLLETVAQP